MWDTSHEDATLPRGPEIEGYLGLPARWRGDPFWFLKYIDDGLGGEALCNTNALSHITTRTEEKMIHASESEHLLKLTKPNATRIGMVLHEEKTKMLCVNVARNSHISNSEMKGGEEMKILGIISRRKPTAEAHVKHVCRKFYSKLWIVRHLSKSGSSAESLKQIYCEL